MNVGSILNGESPSKVADAEESEPVGPRPSFPDLHHRQSINNLLNETPRNGRVVSRSTDQKADFDSSDTRDGSEDGDVDDVDADAEDIDRELAAASLEEAREAEAKEAEARKNAGQTEQLAKTKPEGTTGTKSAGNPAAGKRAELLGSELEKIQRLKATRKKPHRYDEPPVWARTWVPPSQQGHVARSNSAENGFRLATPSMPDATGSTSKSVFGREAMTLADLECLVTGVIPPQLAIRTIAEWLYANFVEILLENRQNVELELKFGTIVDTDTGSRIDVGVSTECIYTNTAKTRFEMGVHEVGWRDMRLFLDELEKAHAEAARKDPTRPRRKFSLTELNSTDYFYQITERNEKPRKIRISKDNLLNPPRYTAISKQRVSDLFIHNPSSMYDLRLSLLIEFPVESESIESIMKKNKPSLQRGKARALYSHAPTVTRFDFTEVSSPRASRNKTGRATAEQERSYELELEIDTFQIFRGFDRIRDGSDTIRFEELVEVFLNNARCLNNRVTKLASK